MDSISRGTKRITDADYEEMIKGADKVGRIIGKSTDEVLTEQGLLSKIDFDDLEDIEDAIRKSNAAKAEAAQNANALDLLRKRRDAGLGTNDAARAQDQVDLLKMNSQISGGAGNLIPTLKDYDISEAANITFGRAALRDGVFDFTGSCCI